MPKVWIVSALCMGGEKPGFYEILRLVARNHARNPVSPEHDYFTKIWIVSGFLVGGEKPGFYEILRLVARNHARNPVSESTIILKGASLRDCRSFFGIYRSYLREFRCSGRQMC